MHEVHVPLGGRGYSVLIEDGLLGNAGAFLRGRFPRGKALLVSDEHVFPLYGNIVSASVSGSGFPLASPFILKPGEKSKSMESLAALLEHCAGQRLSGGDFLIALGGGVVGDLTGFAAAVYHRGIPFAQIPTTLLAAVDASVGGKTAVNLRAGKNLAGAFWQPSMVLCDPQTHKTQSADEYANGLAESIKHGVLFDAELFAAHEEGTFSRDAAQWIARNVRHKKDIVAADERENGTRKLLNFGHTLGHAAELASGYKIAHGAAVAIGMALISRWCHFPEAERLEAVLRKNHLPTQSPYPITDLLAALEQDKKRRGGRITLVVPEKIGRCQLKSMPLSAFQAELAARP